ncbi:chemotaxis protein CheA [Pseudodesulfovibrio tunisiensis]|uniref:chemotaxis protein CheA n=1 Tax=Pseudodesulfovibrio tunisiensis TaxID=463192 RepID=UPI001FB38167|nr:chemotaxis protein CheA [Pseudodesulfovibrio tunisiensis]
MSDDLNRQIFKEEAYDLLSELEGTLLELEQAPEDMDLINRIFRALHTIKGSGSMFGFEDIAEFTHEVETVFDLVRNEELAVTGELCNLALKSRDYIQKMLDNSESDDVVDPHEMEAILSGLQGLLSGGGAEEDVSAGEEAAVESESESSEIETAEPEAESVTFHLVLRSKNPSESDGEKLQSLFEELERLGAFSLLSTPEGSGEPVWEGELVSTHSREDVQDIFFFAEIDLDVTIAEAGAPSGDAAEDVSAPEPESKPVVEVRPEPAPAPTPKAAEDSAEDDTEDAPRLGEMLVKSGEVSEDDVKEALAKQKPLGQILAENGKVSRERVDKAVQQQAQAKEEQASKRRQEVVSSIRVAADKLDYLVDLVGELVIVQAQITQVVGERSDPQMTALAEELERLSDELRDSTLGIRMLPIGTTFSKFRRLVRDLSAELGKEIGLSTSGAETELDKTVIERLGDPLVHLLRNSIDHGIEQPADRKAKGKPEKGMILLSAEHSGGEVLIRITDDGKGMDPKAIREKAIEKGLIASDAELTEKELLKQIFEPGFSTASQVTSVSGRGVGMDVVKRAIDSLRGTIDIDSKPGKGTTITIRLPLTLAIIDGLQVCVEDGYYVIPLSLVEECVELTRETVDESDSGQRILYLRGEIVPYIHLRDWFDIEGESPPIEQIVICGVEGSRVGIVVDTVIGEHQTVIKSLSRVYKDVEGLSGATIKGDGSIALILDVPSLVRRVIAESQ